MDFVRIRKAFDFEDHSSATVGMLRPQVQGRGDLLHLSPARRLEECRQPRNGAVVLLVGLLLKGIRLLRSCASLCDRAASGGAAGLA